MKLAKRGFDIIRKRAADRLSSFLVEEAVHPEKLCMRDTMTLEEAYKNFENSEEWFETIRDMEGNLLGSVSRAQVLEELQHKNGSDVITGILQKKIRHVLQQQHLVKQVKS